jgi:hypothetical protein
MLEGAIQMTGRVLWGATRPPSGVWRQNSAAPSPPDCTWLQLPFTKDVRFFSCAHFNRRVAHIIMRVVKKLNRSGVVMVEEVEAPWELGNVNLYWTSLGRLLMCHAHKSCHHRWQAMFCSSDISVFLLDDPRKFSAPIEYTIVTWGA